MSPILPFNVQLAGTPYHKPKIMMNMSKKEVSGLCFGFFLSPKRHSPIASCFVILHFPNFLHYIKTSSPTTTTSLIRMPAAVIDALVIGAGWSGLTAALQLSKAGKRVVCLEARKRLGGRAFTHSWKDDTPMENNERALPANEKGYTVDFGCSYIHGYEEGNPVKEVAKRYGVVSPSSLSLSFLKYKLLPSR